MSIIEQNKAPSFNWKKIIRCPKCGGHEVKANQALNGSCHSCASTWEYKDNIFSWTSSVPEKTEKRIVDRVFKKLKNQLNPFSSWFLPFRWLTEIRLKNYYQRTLIDHSLAAKWHNHYLKDLLLTKEDRVLDFGCGKGRMTALSNLNGLQTYGQDIQENMWWKKLAPSHFQVVPPEYQKLPWDDQAFSAVFCFGVLHYLDEGNLKAKTKEIFRILKPGGYALFWEANAEGFGASSVHKQIGRLHTLESVRQLLKTLSFNEISLAYEGFYAPIFPFLINYLRKQCSFKSFDMFDFDTYFQSITPPKKRAVWLLKVQKPFSGHEEI